MIDVDASVIDDLVVANHILFDQGIVDAFGHVSVRHPKRPDRFLLARNRAPGIVTTEDIIEFELDGTAVSDNRRPYLERFIHGEIFRARPDVMAVVHSHSPSIVPFSVVPTAPFRAVCHMCGFLGTGVSRFEIRECGSDATDLLIRSQELGAALARSLGSSNAVLMRGHGSTVVAPDLQRAVYRAVYAEVNAKLLLDAMRLGPVTYLTDAEAESCMISTEGQVHRPWEMWKAAAIAARSTP